MATEIERKFLVKNEDWKTLATGTSYCQGYIATKKGATVRVRLAGNQGYLTIKGASKGISRAEYEYEIPAEDAQEMLNNLCEPPLIEKTRYKIAVDNLVWEVDEFLGANQGLIVAEVELTDANQTINIPPWVGQEVSDDPRYYNANLVQHPFRQWAKEEG